jgi:ABC-type cobalamin transport system permease subunit
VLYRPLAFGIAAVIVAVGLSLLTATVALVTWAFYQSSRLTLKVLDASITGIDTRANLAHLIAIDAKHKKSNS